MAGTKKASATETSEDKPAPAQELALVEEERNLAPIDQVTPMQMLATAVQRGTDLVQVEKLMELERTWKADKAREAYYLALAEFKKQPITVTKDKKNAQYNSKYASIGNLVTTVNAAMAPFGLNASWDFDQSQGIKVTCILAHTLGHTQSVSLSGPPDESGKKNSLQQIKSTNTYLRKETFEAVTGVVTSDTEDNDGNSAVETINQQQAGDLIALMDEVGLTPSRKKHFFKWAKISAVEEMPVEDYAFACKYLKKIGAET